MTKLLLIAAFAALFVLSSASVKTESLEAHNKYRADVGLSNLVWSASLAEQAQSRAEAIAETDDTSSNAGENIASGSSRRNTITGFVDAWAEEKEDFIEGMSYPACSATGDVEDVEHYTQMVWEKTTNVGCGSASRGGKMYYVCQYSPVGNVDGEIVYTLDDAQPEDPAAPAEPEQPEEPESSDPFIAQSLAAHNEERKAYGLPALKWSTKLAQSAKAYSQVQASTGTTSHSKGRVDVGENLAWGSGGRVDVPYLAGMWLDERKYFIKGKNFPNCSNTGSWSDVAHYTTLMWRKTTEVGCGITKSKSGMNYYVCHYSPRGNTNGQPVF